MTIKMLHSSNTDALEAVADIVAQLEDMKPNFIMWFASPRYVIHQIATEFSSRFPGAAILGCTSAGEITTGRMLKGCLVAMVADEQSIPNAHVALVSDVTSSESVSAALASLSEQSGCPSAASLDPERFVGLILQDGLSGQEEEVMSVISGATNVPFVGGSAGDELAFERAQVFVGGHGGAGRAAVALIEPKNGYRVLKSQSFKVLERTLEVTECDVASRTVESFSGKPAAQAYAEALGIAVDELTEHFADRPLGLLVSGGEPFVRSPRAVSQGAVRFYCRVLPGTVLHVLETTDVVERTKSDLGAACEAFPQATALINFHCILRTLDLERTGAIDAYGALFQELPTIGFSTYGESYVGHINQTSTMVLIGG